MPCSPHSMPDADWCTQPSDDLLDGRLSFRVSDVCAVIDRDVVREAGQLAALRIRNGKGEKQAHIPLTQRAAVAISR